MSAWYNENDPKAAAWLRELIKRGLIADGVVDERSIEDITPAELAEFAQCHFFAGIGVWSYALRLAHWPDDRRVWTGSCPCQPLSQAGKGLGFADERHLWPAWEHLIRECHPPVLFGEQVASKAAGAWADLVQDDLEALDYAFGAIPFPAASVGAPHIRDRLYWMAHHHLGRLEHAQRDSAAERGQQARALGDDAGGCGGHGDLADSSSSGLEVFGEQQARGQRASVERGGAPSKLGNARLSSEARQRPHGGEVVPVPETEGSRVASEWSSAEWIFCRDGKWRPVEPGSFPLAHGAPERVGRLRGYGNAVVSEAARIWIEACIEADV